MGSNHAEGFGFGFEGEDGRLGFGDGFGLTEVAVVLVRVGGRVFEGFEVVFEGFEEGEPFLGEGGDLKGGWHGFAGLLGHAGDLGALPKSNFGEVLVVNLSRMLLLWKSRCEILERHQKDVIVFGSYCRRCLLQLRLLESRSNV